MARKEGDESSSPPKHQFATMAHHRITDLTRRARRIEPQYLIQKLLHIRILMTRSGRKPVPSKQLVNCSQRERQSSFHAVDGAEFGIHEDV